MSHKTQIKTKLDNLSFLTKGLEELNIKFRVAQNGEQLTTRGRYGVHEKVDVLITEINGRNINEAIGFQKQEDGTYTAIGDFYGTGMSEQKLRNIATSAAKKVEANERLTQLGFSLDKTEENDQEITLEFTRWV